MNIYHVIADNCEPWPEDHDERHEVVSANTEEEAIENSGLKNEYPNGTVEAILVFENVILSSA